MEFFRQNETIYNILLCDILSDHNKNNLILKTYLNKDSTKTIISNKINIDVYRQQNSDLKNLSEKQLIQHYNYYGKYENRIYSDNI